MTVVFNKKILSLVMQGEGEKIIQIFTLSLLCNGYTTSKMQTPKIIRINIFLINSSRVLVIEVFDYSRQTNTLQFPSNSSFSLSVCKVFFPSNCISNWRWQAFFTQSNLNISARSFYVQNRIQVSMNLT